MQLSFADWVWWLAVIFLEGALAIRMASTGAHRRWRGLFALVLVLLSRNSIRLAAILIFRNPFLDFYTFWAGELLAYAAKVWMLVDIGVALAGVSEWSRRTIRQSVPLLAGFAVFVSVFSAFAHHSYDNLYAWFYFIAQRADIGVALAFLTTFLVLALTSDAIGIEWSHGARGVAGGLILDLVSCSLANWLTVHSSLQHLYANCKSATFMVSLVIWIATTGRQRQKADYGHLHSEIARYFDIYINAFKRLGVEK